MSWLSSLYPIFVASAAFCTLGLVLVAVILLSRKFLIKVHPCKLRINNDDSLTKTVDSGKTLLSSLLDSGIAIPSPCGGKASCKQCKVRIAGSDNLFYFLVNDKVIRIKICALHFGKFVLHGDFW